MDVLTHLSSPNTICNGKGWVQNPQNRTGFFACRGCTACENARKPGAAPPEAAPPKAGTPGPTPAPAPQAAPTPQRCSSVGQEQVLTLEEAKSRRPLCKGCGQKLKIGDKDFNDSFTGFKVPKHMALLSVVRAPLPTPAELRAAKENAAAVVATPGVAPVAAVPPASMSTASENYAPENDESYPEPEDHGPNPHDHNLKHYDRAPLPMVAQEPITPSQVIAEACVEKQPESRLPLPVYQAPDALPSQMPLIRVPHTLEEVEAAGGYKVVLADPPWSYVQGGRGSTDAHYQTMTIEQIKALPIKRLASKDAVLFLWGTWPQLPDVLATMEAWGFSFKTCGFVWTKHHEGSGKECIGGGFWTRANSEFCLIGVRGKHPKRIDKSVRQLVQAPRGEHSAKPTEVRDRIYQLMGELPAIELFARDRDSRFDAWGNDRALGGSDVIL